jgi:hypothetical protein
VKDIALLGLSLWLLAEATDASANRRWSSPIVLRFATHRGVPTVGSPKPLRHNHPGESAARAMTTQPDSRQGMPMQHRVGHPADSGSFLASRGLRVELAVRQRPATDNGTGDMPKIPVRTGAPTRSPCCGDGPTRALLCTRVPRQTVQRFRPSIQLPPGGANRNQIGENRWASTPFVRS